MVQPFKPGILNDSLSMADVLGKIASDLKELSDLKAKAKKDESRVRL